MLGVGIACLLLAMKRSGDEKQVPVVIAQQQVLQKTASLKANGSTETIIAAGSDVACALLSCPAVLSVTD